VKEKETMNSSLNMATTQETNLILDTLKSQDIINHSVKCDADASSMSFFIMDSSGLR
jgi:hypothetical protein